VYCTKLYHLSLECGTVYCTRVAGFYETSHLRTRKYYITNKRKLCRRVIWRHVTLFCLTMDRSHDIFRLEIATLNACVFFSLLEIQQTTETARLRSRVTVW